MDELTVTFNERQVTPLLMTLVFALGVARTSEGSGEMANHLESILTTIADAADQQNYALEKNEGVNADS